MNKAIMIFLILFCVIQTQNIICNQYLSGNKITYTKWYVNEDTFEGSDVFITDSSNNQMCLTNFSKESEEPKISDDGKFVLYNINSDTLVLATNDGSGRVVISENIKNYLWHPDSRYIIYSDHEGIKIIDKDNKETNLLHEGAGWVLNDISTDGDKIICSRMFGQGGYGYTMYLLDVSSSELLLLDGPGEEKRFGAFSHDSKFLVYTGGQGDLNDNIYSYDLDNNTYFQLTESDGEDLEPIYSFNDEYIYFVSTRLQDEHGNYKLYSIKVDGNDEKMIYEQFGTNLISNSNSNEFYFLGSSGIYKISGDGYNLELVVPKESDFISDFDIAFVDNVLETKGVSINLPSNYELDQNYPNPFNPSTKINYSIQRQSFVAVKVFDVLGREIRTLINKEQRQGNYSVDFDASNLTSGIYFYRIQAGGFVETKKMVLMK